MEKQMERKRWRALTPLFVAFLFSNAVLSAHSAVAAPAATPVVYRGPSCNGSDINCEAEEDMEFQFGSEIEREFLEPQMRAVDYKPLILEEFLLHSGTNRRFLQQSGFTYGQLKRDQPTCREPGKPYTCLPLPSNLRQRNCQKIHKCPGGG